MSALRLTLAAALCALFIAASAQDRPLVRRPRSARRFTTALTIDGGGMRCLIPSIVAVEIENAIKRYLLAHPEHLPEDAEFETVDDFDILLADFFDAMSGVSGGSWTTAYLSSKGGQGAVEALFSQRRIIRRYGRIRPGQAAGLEVFFMEFGDAIYPGGIRFNITPPTVPPEALATLPNLTEIAAASHAAGFTPNIANFTPTADSLVPNFTAIAAGAPAAAAGVAATLPNVTGLDAATVQQFLPGIEIPGVNAPFFPVEGLEAALETFLGDVTLGELSTYYVVHAYDLRRRQNVYFVHDDTGRRSVTFTSSGVTRNRPREVPTNADDEEFVYEPDSAIDEGLDFFMKDVTRGSSAVPGFHEAKVMSPVDTPDIEYSLIDGAAVTNNPALQTLIFLSTEPRLIPIEDVAMISLGTGVALQDVEGNVDASALGWLVNNALISIMADGSAENVQSQVDFLFYGNPAVRPGQYLRVQTTAELNTSDGDALSRVTDPEYLPAYKRIGTQTARRYRRAINLFVSDFIFASEE